MAQQFDQGWKIGGACFYEDALDAAKVELASKRSREGVQDMTTLDDLTEATMLSTLRSRYARQEIYTSVGGILVAVNPYESLDASVYGEDVMSAAAAADAAFTGASPHPYILAESALRALDREHKSQSFVISGESGSGKTETCKYVLRYLSYRSKRRYEHTVSHAASDARSKAIEESVLLSNPILESFGNAKTVRNNNSSRWGKYTEVVVQPNSGAIEGVSITAYLLEKVRVVEHAAGERNYHIFYQIMRAGLADVGPEANNHEILRTEARIPHEETYTATLEAMRALGVDDGDAWNALCAVLHLGDVTFEAVDDVAAVAATDLYGEKSRGSSALACAAAALGVTAGDLSEALCLRNVAGVRANRTAMEADAAKRAFAKALYARIFNWVLSRVNDALHAMTQDHETSLMKTLKSSMGGANGVTGASSAFAPKKDLTIGLLDIFGFECFAVNSLEQLLINYANERLLREFNRAVFVAAAAEYAAEGVSVGDLSFHDNSALLLSLEDPKKGIFAQLNSECIRRDGTDDNFLKAVLKNTIDSDLVFVPKVRKNSTYMERSQHGAVFAVSHFAADVSYRVVGFVDKNRDRVPDEICALVASSERSFVASLFADVEENPAAGASESNPGGSGGGGGANATPKEPAWAHKTSRAASRYVAAQFAESLTRLTKILESTTQSFVRCVRPNHVAEARRFENVVVLDQLRCMGMLELVAARGRGYASRSDHDTFMSRYQLLLEDELIRRHQREMNLNAAAMASSAAPPAAGAGTGTGTPAEAAAAAAAASASFFSGLMSTTAPSMMTTTTANNVAKTASSAPLYEVAAPPVDEFCTMLGKKLGIAAGQVAVGKTKVFVRRDAMNALETAREEQLAGDVLLALREAAVARNAMQLEITLRIADELRLGESDQARHARSVLSDVVARTELVEALDEGDHLQASFASRAPAIDQVLADHGFDPAVSRTHGVVTRARLTKDSGVLEDDAKLPFSAGLWFAGQTWSEATTLCVEVARCVRDGLATADELKSVTAADREKKVQAAEALERTQRDRFQQLEAKIERLLCASSSSSSPAAWAHQRRRSLGSADNNNNDDDDDDDSSSGDADDAAKLRKALAVAARQASDALTSMRGLLDSDASLVALRAATVSAAAATTLRPALETYLRQVALSNGMAKESAEAVNAARTKLEEFEVREALIEAVRKAGPDRRPALEQAIDAANFSNCRSRVTRELDAATKALEKLDLEKPRALPTPPRGTNTGASATKLSPMTPQRRPSASTTAATSSKDVAPPTPPAASSSRGFAAAEQAPNPWGATLAATSPPLGFGHAASSAASKAAAREAEQMAGISESEAEAIRDEKAKQAYGQVKLFTELSWKDRVQCLFDGTSTLKLTATGTVSGADWKKLRLECDNKTTVLQRDPMFRAHATRSSAFLTWGSNTLIKRASRKLALSSIVGVHVGTNAKQWCTVVPTEWHYMALTTRERSFDFGFTDTAELLLWVNTLQRLVFPDWALECDAGNVAELFKGAISDAQHRFHRARHAGAHRSASFDPTIPELCPALYAMAPQLESACVDLGVSYAAGAPRPHKYCAWTAVAVLEAPIARDAAIASMRAVLTDLGFYASGRFACSAGFYDENGLAHTLAQHASQRPPELTGKNAKKNAKEETPKDDGMLIIRAQHAKTGKISVLRIKKGTKMASVFEAHAKHKGLRNQSLSVVKPR